MLSLLALSACNAPEAEDDELSSESDAVVDGQATLERPEIGAVFVGNSLCTGTLVTSNVVLTAAHCMPLMNDVDVSASEPRYSFVISKSDGARVRYPVDRAHTILRAEDIGNSQRWRSKDIALLRLSIPVPAEVARPSTLARSWPLPGATVGIFGYGCNDRTRDADGRRPGTGTKRKKTYTWTIGLAIGFSDTQNMCPGDSGGPLLDLGRNAILGINSGYVNDDDRFGDVPANRSAIERVIAAWQAR